MEVGKDAITRRNSEQSPLLCLPAELRNNIYELVIGGNTVDVNRPYYAVLVPGSDVIAKSKVCITLTLVCRQLHTETALLPFSLNTFNGCLFDTLRFLKHLSKTQITQIKAITAYFGGPRDCVYSHSKIDRVRSGIIHDANALLHHVSTPMHFRLLYTNSASLFGALKRQLMSELKLPECVLVDVQETLKYPPLK